ncbi:hypothetical protein ACFYO0_45395 [Streptomyces sp. NPDC006365]|uniref:hypothetical protein n=1 Tax=Streptomyces sp. NPDC006365 TaxID=3364744 RepID=UPI0036B2EA4B
MVALRGRGPLCRRSRRCRLIRGRQRRKPTLRQRRRSPRRRRVLHRVVCPRTKPRHYVLRFGVLTPRVPRRRVQRPCILRPCILGPCVLRFRVLRFRLRRLTLPRLSVLRLGIVTRRGILGLRVLGLQVPRRNSVLDLVVLGLGILARTRGNDINLGEFGNVSGLVHDVADVAFVVLRLAGPLGQILRGRPLKLFLFVYAIDATVARPTAEGRHLNSIRVVNGIRVVTNTRVVTNIGAGVSGSCDLIGAE